nr:MAG TPA: hypothetical protein [Caudoviricetes sp.]
METGSRSQKNFYFFYFHTHKNFLIKNFYIIFVKNRNINKNKLY